MFQKGNKLGGRTFSGYQSFKDRLTYWYETKTVKDIEAIISNPKKWEQLSAIDATVAMRISEAYERGGSSSLTIILDRLLGKPVQPIAAEFKVTHELGKRLDDATKLVEEKLGTTLEGVIVSQLEDKEKEDSA